MDAQAIINVLNRILDLGDTLDNAGGGVQGLTNGEHTTREVCRIELGQFLLYIADGATSITDAQAALLSFVFSEGGSMIPGWQLKQLAKTSGTPDPNKNLTFTAFIQADLAVSVQEGERTTAGTDTLFTIYDTFGQLIVAFNENAISQERYDRTIAGFRARVASAGSDAGKTSDKSSKVNKANGKGKTEKAPKAKSSGKQKTASKKEKASSTSRKKAGSAADTAKRDRKTIPAKDVLLPGKYKGIHNVTGKPETVSPYGTWTMDIPAGFSYTMDPDCAARSMMGMGPAYSLQVQATEDCDFSSAYDSSFGLAIYPSSVVWVNIEDGGEDLRSSYAQNTLRDLQNDGFRSYTVLVHTPDVLVQYDNSNRDSEAITINFQIICAGVNAGTNGQIDVQGPDMYKLEEKALEMLASVGSVQQGFNTDQYVPFAIPSTVPPVLKTPETIEIAPSVTLPIPDGFHATKDQSVTGGRSFIIVPEAYPFSKDPMQATVGISGANGQINLPDRYEFGTTFRMILPKLPDEVFSENSETWFLRISDSYAAFFQENHDENAPTWALYRIMLFAGSQAFILSMRINFGSVKQSFQATSIDARNIVRHWLCHIAAKDTKSKDIPVASPKVPDIFYEHYTLVTSGQYTTHRDADFVGQPIRMLMEKHDSTSQQAYGMMEIPGDDYALDAEARRMAKVFRLDEGLFDPYKDTEAMIRLGMFHDVKMFHALRSLAWTVSCMADRESRTLGSYSFEELNEIGEAIDETPLNYNTESWCSGLCSHYDWHVFYVPDAYIESDCRDNTDLRLLCGKENRGGNSISIMMPGLGLGGFGTMNRVSDLITRCEETLESLEALRKDLVDLLPVMQTIYDGFMLDRDRSEPLGGVLAEALTAWCALAIAAKEPFYSEEAADTPEADAGLDGPMERPTDDLDAAPVARKTGTSSKPVVKKPSRPLPAGEVLDLGSATVIEAGKYSGNMTLKNIVIPEGVTEIGEYAFYSCMFLETVALPKTLKKIGQYAFMSCRALRQVEIPEGVEQIDNHAFGATNNLKEVHLPDSLKTVHRYIFGLGGDSPYATAYMSGELASRLQAGSNDPQWLSAISARHYVIDGKGYENMYDFDWTSAASEEQKREWQIHQSVVIRQKSIDNYRADMEAACREGKALDEMIDAARAVVEANYLADKEAFEKALKHLDRDAKVTFKDKHFVLTGFDANEGDVISEIEKRGGIIHKSMVKSADYLVVCLRSPGASKLNKALEWRQKGVTNLIVSDYQMWQAILGGKVKKSSTKKETAKASATKEESGNNPVTSAFAPMDDANGLMNVCRPEQYRGIRRVDEGSEYISRFGIWALKVPAGYAYTMDKSVMSQEMGATYEMVIQHQKDCNFQNEREVEFSLSIFIGAGSIMCDDGGDDLTSASAQRAIKEYKQKLNGLSFKTLKKSSELIVEYANMQTENETGIVFFVVTSGVMNGISLGSVMMRGNNADKLKEEAIELIKSIEKVPVTIPDRFVPSILPAQYALSFDKGETLTASDGLVVPVPDGFKGSTDTNQISTRSFSMIPASESFWNGKGDNNVRIDISGMMVDATIPDDIKRAGKIYKDLIDQLPGGILESNTTKFLVYRDSDSAIFMEMNYDVDNADWENSRAVYLKGTKAYVLNVRLHFDDADALKDMAALVETRELAMVWLKRLGELGEVKAADRGKDPHTVTSAAKKAVSEDNKGKESDKKPAKKGVKDKEDRWANLTEDNCRKILDQHISKNPTIVFNDRTFVFCSCGKDILDNDGDSLESTLQYLGGKIGKGVGKSVDYLVVMSSYANVTQQLRKAIDYIDNGDSNMQIVLLQDLKETVEQEMKLNADRPMTLDIGREKVIKVNQYNGEKGNLRGKVIIPEGVTEICDNGFKRAKMTHVVLPKSLQKIGSWAFATCPHLRTIDCQNGLKCIDENAFYGCPSLTSVNIQEGVEKIEFLAFSECPNLKKIHLPDSIKHVNRLAFVSHYGTDEPHSDITLDMSGMLARYLDEHNDYPSLPAVYAHAYIIDGKQFASIGDYIKQAKEQEQLQREEAERRRAAEERVRQENTRREREEAERKAAETRKAAERDRINGEINSLRAEMDGLRGLFAGLKRKKLQKRIDELNEQLRRL